MNSNFREANDTVAKHLAEIDEQISKMIGFMAQLEELHQGMVDALTAIPRSERFELEQWMLVQLIGEESARK